MISPEEEPEVFALKKDEQGWKVSRRGFLAASGAAMAALAAGCSPTRPTPEKTAAPKQEPSATPIVTYGSCKGSMAHQEYITAIAIHPKDPVLISASADRTIKTWTLPGVELKKSIKEDGWISSLVFSPDGSMLVSTGETGTIKLWAFPTLEPVQTLDGHSQPADCLAISPDGKILASGGRDYVVKLWSLPDGELLNTLEKYTSPVNSLIFSPDGKTLFAGGSWHIRLYSIPDGTFLSSYGEDLINAGVQNLAIRPDGSLLAAATSTVFTNLWSTPDGTLVNKIMDGSQGGITRIAISPDGNNLATGGMDGTVKLWSLPEGGLLQTLNGHSDKVNDLVFSSDGKLLVSGGADKALMVWSLPDGQLASCAVDLENMTDESQVITYDVTDSAGQTATYTLPCGSPLPDGAVCTCNCVSGSVCACVGHSECSCVGYSNCSCVGHSNCVCVGHSSGGGAHYWYPN